MPNSAYRFRFVVDAAHHGRRIDTFLTSRLRNHSSAQMLRLARAGLVRVNDVICETDQRVHRGEDVSLWLAEPPETFYPAEAIGLHVLYEDPWLLAINKPAGMLVHPAGPTGGGTIANAVQNWLDSRTRLAGLQRPGIVHRLDRETSGVMLIARDSIAHAALTRQFERGVIRKRYCAIVAGHLISDEGVIRAPIGNLPGGLRMGCGPEALRSRAARTEFRVLRRLRSTTLVLARPMTGRKHQIRVHFALEGHPILGDAVYAPRDCQSSRPKRHALHAASISFRHPVTNAMMRIDAPPPDDFWGTLADL